jgi:EAL domain-containing protein (putative c-di-GMP-specific phosphodiesterase class I)
LHLKVIAEGVETDAQLHFLKRHGCDQVQGFLYGEPIPPEQYSQLLERTRRKGKRA